MELFKNAQDLWTVILDRNEYIRGAKAGFIHCCNNIANGRKDRRGVNSFDSHVFGSVAEYAFALAIQAEWWGEREGHFNRADVAPYWQVRWSSRPEYGLVQKKQDSAKWNLVLCSGKGNAITIHGWKPCDETTVTHDSLTHPLGALYPFVEWGGCLIPDHNVYSAYA